MTPGQLVVLYGVVFAAVLIVLFSISLFVAEGKRERTDREIATEGTLFRERGRR